MAVIYVEEFRNQGGVTAYKAASNKIDDWSKLKQSVMCKMDITETHKHDAHTRIHVITVKIAFTITQEEKCSSFVWNSQGAVFHAHRSERLWFADYHHIFYFSQKKRHVKRNKQLAQIMKTRSTAYISQMYCVHLYGLHV